MDLGKKLATNFSGAISRAKQYTQEVLGTCDKTELNKQFEELEEKCEKTKLWTEKIVSRVEMLLQPNPNARVEDFLLEKLDKKRERLTPFEQLAQDMIDAGSSLGTDKTYGGSLLRMGKTFQSIAEAEREYIRSVLLQYVQPLKNFLENDVKTIAKERKLLESKRLDLDVCKNKVKKLKSTETNTQAEQELRIAQGEYDRQLEITKLLLESINSTHANHMRCLQDFVECQLRYYNQCQQHLAELERQLNGPLLSEDIMQEKKKARVIKSYTSQNDTELSVEVNDVIVVLSTCGPDSSWMFCEQGTQKGKIPSSCLELIAS